MKRYLILISTILFFCTNSFAIALPTNWFSLENSNDNEDATIDSRESALETHIQSLLGVYDTALNKKNNSFNGGWELSELETDISISKEGILGFGTLESEVAVELVWAKTNSITKNVVALTDGEQSNPDAFAENMALKLQKMNKFKSGKYMTEFKNHLAKKIKSTAELMSHIPLNKNQQYSLDSFKIIISLDTEGKIIGHKDMNLSFTLEIFWNYNPEKHTVVFRDQNSETSNFLDRTLDDITYASSKSDSLKSFSLDKIGIALAISEDGIWGISNTAVGIGGVLYLKRNSNFISNTSLKNNLTETAQEVVFLSNPSINSQDKSLIGGLFHFKRNRMRKGLIKTMKIANFITKSAEKVHTSKWNLDEIKTIFTITKHGIFGLGSASGGSSIEMFYHKKN